MLRPTSLHRCGIQPSTALLLVMVLLAFIGLPSNAQAQTFEVTFRVDMSNETVSASGVHLAGNVQGWDPAATMMQDDDMDGVYEVTVDVSESLGPIEYVFINGNAWGSHEVISAACASSGNRFVDLSQATVLDVVCFGRCAACGVTTVLFQVDMTNEPAINPVGVHMNGNFNGWDGSNFIEMEDADGDLVYSYVAQIEGALLDPVDTVQFKFLNGNAWGFDENPDGECSNVGNRFILLSGADVVYEYSAGQPYCYNQCTGCLEPTPVTFRVDMGTQVQVSPNGVFVAGSFQGWTAGTSELLDPDGDLVYEGTFDLFPGDYEFKFINGNNWGGDGDGNIDNENPPGECMINGNRTVTVGTEPITVQYCYNTCEEDCQPQPPVPTVTVELALEAEAWMDAEGYLSLFVEGDWPGAGQGSTGFEQSSFGSSLLFSIPDDQTQCFSQGVNVTGYPEGAVLGGSLSLDAVAVNMEHSFMGDLTITVICPNGASMGVHQQGGGATFLGVPVDNDATPNVPGVGYDYVWSPAATNGTWEDNAGGTLPPGNYESVQPWSLLEGCPLNGTWTFEVCDSWGSDNGFIFGWEVQFSEPSATTLDVMELDPADGLHKLQLELAVQDVEMGFGFDVLAFNEVSFPLLDPELEFSTCGIGDRARHFEPSDFSALSSGDTVRYVHQPTGLVHCAGQCEPCAWPGCTDPVADNFNAEANLDDGSCNYPFASCDEIGEDGWADLPLGFYPGAIEATVGVDTTWQVVFNLPPLVSDDTGFQNQSLSFNAVSWEGWPPGAWGGDSVFDIPISGGTQSCIVLHGFPTEAGTYTLTLTGTLVVSIFGSPFNIEGYAVPLEITVLESPNLNCFPFPDFGGASFAYEPDGVTTQLETAQVGDAYGDALHIRWPSFFSDVDPDIPLDAPIDSVLVSAVSLVDVATGDTVSLETVGLSLDCAQMEVEPVPDCAFLGGEDACFALSGIPQLPGEFLLLVEFNVWATIFGFPLATPLAFPGWPLTIVASGCTDPAADNYDPTADVDDGSCSNFTPDCEAIGAEEWAELELSVHPVQVEMVFGVDAGSEWVLNVPPTLVEPASGSTFAMLEATPVSAEGLPEGIDLMLPSSPLDGGSQACMAVTGMPLETGLFEVEYTCDVVLSLFGQPFPVGDVLFTQTVVVAPNPNPIPGCTYSGAANYVPFATVDDGGCVISGCMDAAADNYHPIFNEDDGSCLYGGGGGSGNACPADVNNDALIGVADLLILLGEFGLTCTP